MRGKRCSTSADVLFRGILRRTPRSTFLSWGSWFRNGLQQNSTCLLSHKIIKSLLFQLHHFSGYKHRVNLCITEWRGGALQAVLLAICWIRFSNTRHRDRRRRSTRCRWWRRRRSIRCRLLLGYIDYYPAFIDFLLDFPENLFLVIFQTQNSTTSTSIHPNKQMREEKGASREDFERGW